METKVMGFIFSKIKDH